MRSRLRRVLPICFLLYMQGSVAEIPVPDPTWAVARAQFTSGIKNREPVDQLVVLSSPATVVYFFTDLRHMGGRQVQHRWSYQGQVVSMKPFNIKGERWRVFSKNVIEPNQTGEWSVTVFDESGWPLRTELFLYEQTNTDSPAIQAEQVTSPSE